MKITVKDILNRLAVSAKASDTTVDKLVAGKDDTEVTGIAVAFMATHHILKQSLALGANLVISHEGVFYNHRDGNERLESDPVYQEKQRLIEESGVAIYRLHDLIHENRPDGIMEGLLRSLDWKQYVIEDRPASSIVDIPAMTIREVAEYVKTMLDIPFVRIVGDTSTVCKRVGLLAGYRGGGAIGIPLFEKVDLIIAGEGPEWETPEYVRDAVYQGRRKGLIMLGHAESEEPGMKLLAGELQLAFPEVPVRFISDQPLFQVI
ncbi:Nif3-like dinuclear metal center hexameric protein [Paenibacillus sp. GCM10027628]|uniref:Nif3-like dinuclear metal center hexameric protein n=1 Tax=Paenibacillus sp. GCM10027628 TaxID=3273413 RepID=UPI00362E0ADE